MYPVEEFDEAEVTRIINNGIEYNYDGNILVINNIISGKLFSFLLNKDDTKKINIGPFKDCSLINVEFGDQRHDTPLYIRRATFIVGNIEARYVDVETIKKIDLGCYDTYIFNSVINSDAVIPVYGNYLVLATWKNHYAFLIEQVGHIQQQINEGTPYEKPL